MKNNVNAAAENPADPLPVEESRRFLELQQPFAEAELPPELQVESPQLAPLAEEQQAEEQQAKEPQIAPESEPAPAAQEELLTPAAVQEPPQAAPPRIPSDKRQRKSFGMVSLAPPPAAPSPIPYLLRLLCRFNLPLPPGPLSKYRPLPGLKKVRQCLERLFGTVGRSGISTT